MPNDDTNSYRVFMTFNLCSSSFKTRILNEKKYFISHTRTVMRECCKGDDQSQWRRANFDPPPPLNPLTDLHQNLHRSLSRGYLPPCKISFRSDKGFRFRACATSCTNVYSAIFWGSKAPFTRYNLLTNRLSNRFDNRLIVNRFDNRLYRVNGV